MWNTKPCKMCGMEFYGKANAKYCCAACRIEYQDQYAKRWRDENQEKYAEYMREYLKIGGKDAKRELCN